MEIDDNLIQDLRPQFTAHDLSTLKTFAAFDAKYNAEISTQLRKDLTADPVFRDIINHQSPEAQQKQNELSRKLQHDAIINGQWEPYTKNLVLQGITYARMGLKIKDWFRVVQMYRKYIQPYILKEFHEDLENAGLVWEGLNNLIDFALLAITESYFIEKNKIIKSEQQRKEDALSSLQESEERLRAIYGNTHDPIYMVDKNGIIESINHVTSGYKKEEVIGSCLFDYYEKNEKDKIKKAVSSVFEKGSHKIYHSKITSKNGTKYYSNSAAPLFKDDRIYGAVIVSRDITDQAIAQQQVRELNETLEKKVEERTAALQAVNEELRGFSYTVSHDLRAPLRAIDGFSKVLKRKTEGQLNAAQTHYLDVIIENVGKMGQLIDDLLSFSRMGRQLKKASTFDMEALVHQVFQELMQTEDASRIKFKVAPLPNPKADREMMRHVMANLLGNAIKFSSTREESVIEVGAKESDESYTYFIKDNGVGFDMEYDDKIFGIFQRLHGEDEFDGTGVGLAIVQRIVHRHQGQVWAKGELDKGATFYFSLPKIQNQ